MNVLLVYPRSPDRFWSFRHVLKLVARKSAFPPLGLLTVAAMLPREWSLKMVDLNGDLAACVQTLQRAGLEVMGGFIVGFDCDPKDIFARQFEFIQRSGVVTAMVGLLTALPHTALYRRLAGEGRILAHTSGDNTHALLNFVPRPDRDAMIGGYRDLMRKLYAPANDHPRIRAFLRCFEPRGPSSRLAPSDVKGFM